MPTDPLDLWAELLAERPDLAPERTDFVSNDLERLCCVDDRWGWLDADECAAIDDPAFAISRVVDDDDALAHLVANAARKVAAAGWWIDERVREDGSTYWQAFNISGDAGGLFEVDSYDAALVSALTSAFPKKGGA